MLYIGSKALEPMGILNSGSNALYRLNGPENSAMFHTGSKALIIFAGWTLYLINSTY